MRKLIITSIILLSSNHAFAQNSCPAVGSKIVPISFEQALTQIKPVSPKGEFETTDQYNARIAGANGSNKPLMISKKIESPDFMTYNADKMAFEIKSYLFDNTNFQAWLAMTTAKVDIDASSLSNIDVVISSTRKVTGTYTAQNGFGAKGVISRVTKTDFAIFDKKANLGESIFFSNEEVIGEIPISIEKAKNFKNEAKAAFVIVPKSPYFVKATFPFGQTTITNPVDMTVNANVILADIQCALLLDKTNTVVGAFETK